MFEKGTEREEVVLDNLRNGAADQKRLRDFRAVNKADRQNCSDYWTVRDNADGYVAISKIVAKIARALVMTYHVRQCSLIFRRRLTRFLEIPPRK